MNTLKHLYYWLVTISKAQIWMLNIQSRERVRKKKKLVQLHEEEARRSGIQT